MCSSDLASLEKLSQYTRSIQWWMDPVGQVYDVPPTSTHYEEAVKIVGGDVDENQALQRLLSLGWMQGTGPWSGQIRVKVNRFDENSQFLIGDLAQKTGTKMIVLDTARGTASLKTQDFVTIDPSEIESASNWNRIYSRMRREADASDTVLTGTIEFRRPTWSFVEIVQIDGQEFASYNLPRGAEAGSVVEYKVSNQNGYDRPFASITRVVTPSPDYAMQALRRIGKVLSLWREWRV